jgi:hypothetical protein
LLTFFAGYAQSPQTYNELPDRVASGTMQHCEFEGAGPAVKVDLTGSLIARSGTTIDFSVGAAIAAMDIATAWVAGYAPFGNGALEAVLESWMCLSGPFQNFSGGGLVPAPLRVFIDFFWRTD